MALNSEECLIIKAFFYIDTPISIVKMLFEDPEKMKIWDPNVKKTELISYLPSHNSKIFIKESKPTKITGKLTKASLI